jgi:ATP-binding cassette subfamily C protein LapB
MDTGQAKKVAPRADGGEPSGLTAALARDLASHAEIHTDPLLACLVFLTEHHQRPYSADVLKAGLPMTTSRLTPSLFVRAAARAGLRARIVKRPLKALTNVVLPAVLILKGDQACVLLEVGPGGATVMLPESGGGVQTLDPDALGKTHAGYVIYARPEHDTGADSFASERSQGRGWFWGPLLESWSTYFQVALAAVMINVFALATPLFIMTVYDRVVPNDAIETLWVLAIGATIVFFFEFAVRSLRGYYIDVAGRRADVVMASRIFDRVLDIQMGARPASAGAFANTLREFETVRDFFTSATLATVVDLPFILLFVGVIWLIGGPIAIVPLVAVPLVLFVGIAIQIPMRFVVRDQQRHAEGKNSVLFETLGGLETIKSIGADARLRQKWNSFVDGAARLTVRVRFLSLMAINFTALVQQFAGAGVVVYGVLLISAGELTVGALIAAVILNGRAVGALAQVAQLLVRMNQARTSLAALDKVMKLPVERPADRNFLHRPRLDGGIEFKGVSFAYPNQPVAALDGVSFKIAPGERVGLIGRVGSGKSTIQKLILNLFQPSEGAVLIDGTDLRQIDPVDLRRNIGAVPQETFLFGGTVRENLTMGVPFANDEAVLRAAQISGVDEFVSRHPMGYDLAVGERGESLSGGQRQAIAVARSILNDPPILLLDEPTSSMDNTAENQLKQHLTSVLAGKTAILVTHRSSLLSMVDRLIVLEQGRVVADGPKQAVLEALAKGQVTMLGS